LNIPELLKNDKPIDLNEFPDLKNYKEHCELKIKSFNEIIQELGNSLHESNSNNSKDTEIFIDLLKKEKSLINEIDDQKKEILNKIKVLEAQERLLNDQRKDLRDNIKKKVESYSNNLILAIESLEAKYDKNLGELRQKYKKDIKSFYIDFDKADKEEVGKRELMKNLSDMSKIRQEYKSHEIEFIRNKLISDYESLITQYEDIRKISDQHKDVSNQYQQNKIETYNLLNTYFSFEKVIELYNEKKKETIGRAFDQYSEHLYQIVSNELRPKFQEDVLNLNCREIMKFTDEVVKNNNLNLQNNNKFVADYLKCINVEVLIVIKYLMHKQKETLVTEEKLYKKYAKIFDDEFAKNLIEKSDLFSCKLPKKLEIIAEFEKIKKDLFFDLLYYNGSKNSDGQLQVKYEKPNILKFLFCSLLSRGANFMLSFYSPYYNTIEEGEVEIIKKMKALSFIQYFLKNEKYMEAFKLFQYLNTENEQFQQLYQKVELRTKNEMVVELLETHLKI
jgi:hypothetical protein